jgi:hypothetical protein
MKTAKVLGLDVPWQLQQLADAMAHHDEQERLEFRSLSGVLRTWMGERPRLRPT